MLNKYYTNNRILFHVGFWLLYYLFFGLLWVKNGDYRASFYLEFILLPMRIFAVYFTIYFLIPKYLLQKKIWQFILSYFTFILVAGCIQQIFTHFFFHDNESLNEIFNLRQILRSLVLVNTTVFFLASIYILMLYFNERDKNEQLKPDQFIELKSNRRVYRVNLNDIIYIEGLGNYVNYHLYNKNKITVYQSLKKSLDALNTDFLKIQKSYIVNINHVKSFNHESIETSSGDFIPIGKNFDLNLLQKQS